MKKPFQETIGLFRVSWEEILRQSNHPCLEYIFLPQVTIVQKLKKQKVTIFSLWISKVYRDLDIPKS